MDERKQYTPGFTATTRAGHDTVSLESESIVEAASDKENDYKNAKHIPEEGVESQINFKDNQSKVQR